jgi:lantibiotic transport system ATP-binding protein
MSVNIIETRHLTKRFKQHQAVVDVNLAIPKGEIFGFLGPNGAGKTTTIRMILGLMKPTHGKINVFGQDLQKEKLKILKRVGSLVESPSYYGHLTAYENLEVLRKILDVPKSRIEEVLRIVRLSNESNRKVKGFSLGMKQRLGIAASLLGNPELLILDEPTNGLDPSGILEMRELIKQLPKEHGITVLVSSHLLSEIDQMATQVGIITKGNLIFQDSIDVLREKAQTKLKMRVNDAESAWKLLLSQGVTAEFENGMLQLDSMGDERVAEIVDSLVKERYSIYRIEEEKMSLESIFLEMTKGERSL